MSASTTASLNLQEQAALFEHAMDINAPASTAVLFQARVLPPSTQTQNLVVVNYLIAATALVHGMTVPSQIVP